MTAETTNPPPPQDWRRFLLDVLPKQSIGAEIGVHLGDFSAQIIQVVQPTELHLIDPWEHQTTETYHAAWYGGGAQGGQSEMDARYAGVRERFARQIETGQIKVHRGYSEQVLEQYPDGYFDWVYIDGNHLYEYVVKDLELGWRKTKPGGLITGDDYGEGGWWDGGVKKAVDEFAHRDGFELLGIQAEQFAFRRLG